MDDAFSFDADDVSDSDGYSSNEERVIGLDELISKQTEINLRRKVENIPVPSDPRRGYLNSQPCLLRSHKLAIQMLKFKGYTPSTKVLSPPVSQIDDGSALIPIIKRKYLPIESRKKDIVVTVRCSRIIVLSGSTGCGKVFKLYYLYLFIQRPMDTF